MPITPTDIDGLIELLRQNPALRERVFAAIAPEEFLELPAKMDRLSNEVATLRAASEDRFVRIEAVLERLVEHQARTEEEFATFRIALGRLPDQHVYLVVEVSHRVEEGDRHAHDVVPT